MEAELFSKGQFKRLKKLKLPLGVTAIESDLYILNKNCADKKFLLKKYKLTDGDIFGNKLLTINSLINNREKIGINELVYPNSLAVVNKKVVGYIMDFVEDNNNLEVLLKNKNIPLEDKKRWLDEVGRIIKKVEYVDNLDDPFYLGDIHESNFILDKKTNKILCVDLDGCKISNNRIYSMRYGSFNEKFYDLPNKYPLYDNDEPIPSQNTEWYCYTIMVLNTIANGPVYKLLIEDFYDYLTYLKDNGFSEELVNALANIYNTNDNYSIHEFLELIPDNQEKVNFDSFARVKKIDYLNYNKKAL